MTSLHDLEARLRRLDSMFVHSELEGLAFEKTYNESLGFKKDDPSDFKVFIPFRAWEKEAALIPTETHFPSALQEAFKNVLKTGSTDNSTCFIDLTSLNISEKFFIEPEDEENPKGTEVPAEERKCLARTIAEVVNATSHDAHPVVRILCGTENSSHEEASWNENRHKYEQMFWPKGTPLVDHPDATLHVGYYAPGFATKAPGVSDWIKQLVDSIKRVLQRNSTLLKLAGSTTNLDSLKLDQVVNKLMEKDLPNISWNHAKIVAVNGKTLMTGGGNYWNEYLGKAHSIVDHQVKIKGDAAISAHKYCDYFWRYLNKGHEFDQISFRRSIPLKTHDLSQWSSTTTVPDTNPFKFNLKEPNIPVLTVSRLGDWFGPMNALPYPVQIIDAARDIILSALWHITSASPPAAHGKAVFEAQVALRDDPIVEATTGKYQELKVNPLAWASRIARYTTISEAKKSVHISQQMLIDTLQVGNSGFDDVTAAVNDFVEKNVGKGLEQWNGWIWPYDLLVAFGWALNAIKLNKGEGVFLILTTSKAGSLPGGWEDRTSVRLFKDRLKIVMKGMSQSWLALGFKVKENEVDQLVDEKFQVKRPLKDDGNQYNHCKIVCVDRSLMYVGSDNTYPCYNEEHGVWIDHRPSIDAWFTSFWNQFWEWSTFATD